jgi:uncharacterized protein YjeT (DUF2065 family)
MDKSIFLAKVFGLYLLLIGLALFLRPRDFVQMMKDVFNNSSAIMLGGIFGIIVGILLLVSHNLWVADWRILITLLAWIAFSKGAVSLFLPNSRRAIESKFENPNRLRVVGVIDILLGAFLAYQGFSL